MQYNELFTAIKILNKRGRAMSGKQPNTELEIIEEIESHLNYIFGHLRDVKAHDGEETYNRLNNYFHSKYGQVRTAEQ
jgi:hypothetical protein